MRSIKNTLALSVYAFTFIGVISGLTTIGVPNDIAKSYIDAERMSFCVNERIRCD